MRLNVCGCSCTPHADGSSTISQAWRQNRSPSPWEPRARRQSVRQDIISDLLINLEKGEGQHEGIPQRKVMAEREIMYKTRCSGNGSNGKHANGGTSWSPTLKAPDLEEKNDRHELRRQPCPVDPVYAGKGSRIQERSLFFNGDRPYPEIPTYSGGLGILAGDILKSAADLGVPMVGITLLYKRDILRRR